MRAPVSIRALIVSLHDVSPLTREPCTQIMAELAALGVRAASLLVIPDHHRRGRTVDDPTLCAWLREQESTGHEIVTHGYFHQRPARPSETLADRVTTRIYTAGEGEFLSEAAAAELYERGTTELRSAGLSPKAFIAPAWLLSEAAEQGLTRVGCEYTTRLHTVKDLQTGQLSDAQSLCWSVRAAWRRALSLGWNALLYERNQRADLLRVSIHPPDLRWPEIWRQIRGLIAEALRTRESLTYWQWISLHRSNPICT